MSLSRIGLQHIRWISVIMHRFTVTLGVVAGGNDDNEIGGSPAAPPGAGVCAAVIAIAPTTSPLAILGSHCR